MHVLLFTSNHDKWSNLRQELFKNSDWRNQMALEFIRHSSEIHNKLFLLMNKTENQFSLKATRVKWKITFFMNCVPTKLSVLVFKGFVTVLRNIPIKFCRIKYRTRAIITRGLYIFYPSFEDHFFDFLEFFQKILSLYMVSNQDGARKVHWNWNLKLRSLSHRFLNS